MSHGNDVAAHAMAQKHPRREALGEPLTRLLVVSCALLVLAIALVAMVVHRAPQLSIFDEPTHSDYAYQISHGHVPARGSTIAPEILREWSCHGYFDGSKLPPCAGPAGRGYHYRYSHDVHVAREQIVHAIPKQPSQAHAPGLAPDVRIERPRGEVYG
jgi:hypothetical protein